MSRQEIRTGTTHTIEVLAFHDSLAVGNEDPDLPTVFLDSATTATVDLVDVTDPDNPIALGSQLTLIPTGSGGNYQVDLPHDFASSALVPKKKIDILSTVEEGAVHWETPTEERVWLVI